jgi:hypothetical protein
MSRFDSATVAASAFATGILLIGLTGCAEIHNLVSQQHEEHFATYAAAKKDWEGVDTPGWIPDDATDLRNVATLDETVARESIPPLAVDWSTEGWPDEVQRCGDYEVMPMEDGWLGWFQAAAPGQTPS